MKKEICIKHFHEFLATTINHPQMHLRWSDKKQAVVAANWGQRLVRFMHPAKKLAEDIRLTEKVIAMRNEAKQGAPFELLGRAQYAFSSKALKDWDNKIRCVEQQVVLTNRTLAPGSFGQKNEFLYGFGAPGNYEKFDTLKQASDLFYNRNNENWDC